MAAFLPAEPQQWRDCIEVIVIDLFASYRPAVIDALPHAVTPSGSAWPAR